jgi:hypothetical protein
MWDNLRHPARAAHNAFGWLLNEIVQDVPEEVAICEFDCDKQQCTFEKWLYCERRLRKAAGELMPSPPSGKVRNGTELRYIRGCHSCLSDKSAA